MSEQLLVQRLKRGAPDAFEELVRNYARRLYHVAFRLLRNAEDAEDAVQETFLNVFQAIQDFRQDSSLYTWLYRIVSNQSLLKLRQQGQRQLVPIEPYLPHFEQGQHSEKILNWNDVPDLPLRTRELSEFFERCIDELPEDHRLAYLLKDVEKLSENEVAEILGVSIATMKNRVHRARLVIRKRVQDHFFQGTRRKLATK